MVRRLEGRRAHQLMDLEAPEGTHAGGGDGVLVVQLREQAGEPLGQHGLARPWRAGEQEVVPARRSDLEGPSPHRLSKHLREVRADAGVLSTGAERRPGTRARVRPAQLGSGHT